MPDRRGGAGAAQVRIDNGKVTRHDGAAGLERTFRPLVKSAGRGQGPRNQRRTVLDRVRGARRGWRSRHVLLALGRRKHLGGRRRRLSQIGRRLLRRVRPRTGSGRRHRHYAQRRRRAGEARDVAVLGVLPDRVSAIERVRVFSEECAIDAGGRSVHWIDDVKPAEVSRSS